MLSLCADIAILHHMALPTREELLAAEFEDSDIDSMIQARRKITAKGGQSLIKSALDDARSREEGLKERGLYYTLGDVFDERRVEDQSQNIADAVDPTWQMIPDPRELQSDATYDEIRGHLSLLRFNYECDKTVFSRDRQSQSHFLLWQHPFVYVSEGGSDESAEFKCFPDFKTAKLDNAPVLERIGLFMTDTEDWPGNSTGELVKPCWHAWVGIVSRKKGKGFRLQIYDPNYHATGRPTIHANKLNFMQKNFIMQAKRAWKTLSLDDLWIMGEDQVKPIEESLQLCSRWLQKGFGNEAWKDRGTDDATAVEGLTRIVFEAPKKKRKREADN